MLTAKMCLSIFLGLSMGYILYALLRGHALATAMDQAVFSGLGIAALWFILQITGPNIIYTHQHFDNPDEHGRVLVTVEGAKFNNSTFAGGTELPKNFDTMMDDALSTIKRYDLLAQQGIKDTDGISELTITIKRKK